MSNRWFGLVVAAIAVTPAIARQAPKTVTLNAVAAPLKVQLATLSKEYGVNLSASPEMNSEPVILRLKDVPLDVLKERLAKATSGRWDVEKDGFRLVADRAERNREFNRTQAIRAQKISESLKKKVEQLNQNPLRSASDADKMFGSGKNSVGLAIGGQGGAVRSNISGDPATRAIIRMVQVLGPNALASVEADERVVYATSPTRAQRALPGATQSAIAELLREHSLYVSAYSRAQAKKPKTAPDGVDEDKLKEMAELFGFEDQLEPKALDGTPAKILLVIKRSKLFGSVEVELLLVSNTGSILLRGSSNFDAGRGVFDFDDFEFDPATGSVKNKPEPPAPKDEVDFEVSLSELSKKRREFNMFDFEQPGQADKKIPDDLREAMLNPEKRDPLSFGESEALIQIAEKKNVNLVALLPDDVTGFSLGVSKGPMKAAAFLNQIKQSTEITTEGGWMVARPADPYLARTERTDRAALGQFIRAAQTKGVMTLDDLAAYALRNREPAETPAAMSYMTMFTPEAVQGGMGMGLSWETLRFFGTLPAPMRAQMKSGEVVPFGRLSPQQQQLAAALLFGPETRLALEADRKKRSVLPPMFEAMAPVIGKSLKTEPTEVMPMGILSGWGVQLSIQVEPCAKPTANSMFGNMTLGADELGMLKFFKESPQFQGMSAMMPSLGDVRVGTRTIYTFKFFATDDVCASYRINDNAIDQNSRPVNMNNLSSEFTNLIQQRMEMLKKLPFFDPSFFGRGSEPPQN
ncbi:MAG: hypothetical protein JST35_07100 [Armatimonadetes bacterium]|nr:hypothetical protein [Armatimonadota bacterium]